MIQGVEPPKDAEGREIPLSTKELYHLDGERVQVASFDYWPSYKEWHVSWFGGGLTDCDDTRELLLSPPDSWELLEHDATLTPRDYLKARGIEEHKDGRIATMMGDLVSRAKALAETEKKKD